MGDLSVRNTEVEHECEDARHEGDCKRHAEKHPLMETVTFDPVDRSIADEHDASDNPNEAVEQEAEAIPEHTLRRTNQFLPGFEGWQDTLDLMKSCIHDGVDLRGLEASL